MSKQVIEKFTDESGRTFEVGTRIRSRKDVDYGRMDGTILEIGIGPDGQTDNEGYYLAIEFDHPRRRTKAAEAVMALFNPPKPYKDISVDYVLMIPDDLEIICKEE